MGKQKSIVTITFHRYTTVPPSSQGKRIRDFRLVALHCGECGETGEHEKVGTKEQAAQSRLGRTTPR